MPAKKEIDLDDAPLTAKQLRGMRPLAKDFPQLAAFAKSRRGRPPVATPKVNRSFRLSAALAKRIDAYGAGVTAKVEKVLEGAFM